MTNEERTEAAKPTMRQRILGSLNDTHALNGAERDRGAASLVVALDLAFLVCCVTMVGVSAHGSHWFAAMVWSLTGVISASTATFEAVSDRSKR